MTLQFASFHPAESGAFKAAFTTDDGHEINVYIITSGAALEEGAVAFANEYLAGEMNIRQQAAIKIFDEHEYIKEELEYAAPEDLLNALEPGSLTILWQQQETRMAYLSPLDDLESCGEKYVILVSYERGSDELEINLEQAPDW